jgi:acyl-CoA reductase-like NAD-dependent aldehyde dehydrogenase
MQEEVFGPVIAVAPFKDVSDALAKLHDTCYGEYKSIFLNCHYKTVIRQYRRNEDNYFGDSSQFKNLTCTQTG